MKRTLHIRKSTPSAVVMCDLGTFFSIKCFSSLTNFVGRLVDLLGDSLAQKAFAQAQQSSTPWFRQMSGWLDVHNLKGLLSEGTSSFPNVVTTLRNGWFSEFCQSSSTKVEGYLDNMRFDSDEMAPYLHA